MFWLGFVLISILSIAVANLFQRLAMKKTETDPIVSSIVFQFLLTLFTGAFALMLGFRLPPTFLILPHFLVSSVLYAFGTLFIFKAIKEVEASELAILVGAGSVATIATAFIFLGERLNPLQFIGVFLILFSIVIAEYRKKRIEFNKWILFGILGNFLYGLAVTNDAFILKSYDAISYTPIMSFMPGLILCLIYPKKLGNLLKDFKGHISFNLGIYTFLYSIQAVTYYFALQLGAMASQVSTIFKSEIILTIILAALFLKERGNLIKKVIAAVLVTIGVILIA